MVCFEVQHSWREKRNIGARSLHASVALYFSQAGADEAREDGLHLFRRFASTLFDPTLDHGCK